MKALVIGGSTFVGRRIVLALATGGHQVAVMNRGKTSTDLPDGVERLTADRTDLGQVSTALGDRSWDAVFDISGFVQVAGGSDMAGLFALFDGQVGRYVYCSSIMAYRQGVGIFPWTEDFDPNPDPPSTYGGFKAWVEGLGLARHRSTGFPFVSIRPAAIYGPDNNIFDMEAATFLRCLQGRPHIVPHGGLVVGSYGHVDDLVDAMIVAATHPNAPGEIFNITTGAVTINHYVETLAGIAGVEPDIRYVSDAVLAALPKAPFGHLFGKAHHAEISSAKATRLLGVTPRIGFDDGHRATFEWFMSSGTAERAAEKALVDPLWFASYDLPFEAEVVEMIGRA